MNTFFGWFISFFFPPQDGKLYGMRNKGWNEITGTGGTDPNAIHLNASSEINTLDSKTSFATNDIFVGEDSEDTPTPYTKVKWTYGTIRSALDPATFIHAATTKDAIVDADEFGFVDTENSNVLKKTTWSNIKSKIQAFLQATALTITEIWTFASTKLAIKGSSTGKNIIASANDGASDYTHTLQKKTGTIAHLDDITGGGAATSLTQGTAYTLQGELLNHSFSGIALDGTVWSANQAIGVITINNKLIVNGGASDFSKYIRLAKLYLYEKKDIIVSWKAVTKNSGDGWGFCQNLALLMVGNTSIYAKFDQYTGTFSFGTTTAANEFGTSAPLTFSAGDNLRLTISIYTGINTIILENLTQPTVSKVYCTYNFGKWGTSGNIQLAFLGGQQEFTNITINSRCRNYGSNSKGVVFFGDSHTDGSGVSAMPLRYTDILMKGQTHLFENIGMGGWMTPSYTASLVTELLTGINAKYLFVCIGFNDPGNYTTTQTRTAAETIATTAQGMGYTVVFISIPPKLAYDMAAYNTAISTAASNTGCKFVNIVSSLATGLYLTPSYCADGIHLNDSGAAIMANAIALQCPEIMADILTDINNVDIKCYNLPFAKKIIPLVGVNENGILNIIDLSLLNFMPWSKLTSYIDNLNRPYYYNTGNLSITGNYTNKGNYWQNTNGRQGLQINFNDTHDANSGNGASNLNITNAGGGASDVYGPDFDNLTGYENIVINSWAGNNKANNKRKVSGYQNILIEVSNSQEISGYRNSLLGHYSYLTSGHDCIGIGPGALAAVTTGYGNIHLTHYASNSVTAQSSSLTNTILIGDCVTSEALSNGDCVFNIGNYYNASASIWLGGKAKGSMPVYVNFPKTINVSNYVGGDGVFRAGVGTGTAEPGPIKFQFSTPVASGSTPHSVYTDLLTLTRLYTQLKLGTIEYHSSTSGDAVNDTRKIPNDTGWIRESTCTVLNATKGAGTWITTEAKRTVSIADDGTVALVAGKSGTGKITIGNDQEFAIFTFATDGTVKLRVVSDNVVNTDTDLNLCIFNNSGTVAIKNRLGSTLIATIIINYNS